MRKAERFRLTVRRSRMNKLIGIAACALALLTTAPASARPVAQTSARVADSTLDKRIEQRIKGDRSLQKHSIHVSVDGGIVTLTGTVTTEAEKARAAQLALISGVTRVDNQI